VDQKREVLMILFCRWTTAVSSDKWYKNDLSTCRVYNNDVCASWCITNFWSR